MPKPDNLNEAKTQLSAQTDRSAAGEDVCIASNGATGAHFVPLRQRRRKPAGSLVGLIVPQDIDGPMPEIERLFEGD